MQLRTYIPSQIVPDSVRVGAFRYHFALPELLETVKGLGFTDAEEMLHTMIDGKRLRDIADLPLDLVI